MSRRHTPLSLRLILSATCLVSLGWSAPAGAATSTVVRAWSEPLAGYEFLDAAVAAAHTSVDLSMYELRDPSFEQELVARARAGVDVRVLLNSAYDGREENEAAAQVLRAGGVHVTWAPAGQIFHAKYLVVDNAAAYVGTGNLVASDYASTRDFWVEDVAPGDLRAIIATFNHDVDHDDVAPRASAGLVWSPGSTTALVSLVDSARSSLLVENEEMDSAPIEAALQAAAARGVAVHVVMTADSAWTSALLALVRAHIVVGLLGPTQRYIHAKVICADCTASSGTVFIGSENFSTSSLDYNRELGVITTSSVAVQTVRTAVDADFALATTLASASMSGAGGVAITAITRVVARGTDETLSAHAGAHESCVLAVTLPSGYASEASGLGAATTTGDGSVTWRWYVSSDTDPGTARATVTCGSHRASTTFTITA